MKTALPWQDVIDQAWPVSEKITEETRDVTIKNARRFRGSVRMARGRFWTTDEYEARRKKILETPLP